MVMKGEGYCTPRVKGVPFELDLSEMGKVCRESRNEPVICKKWQEGQCG